MKRETPRQGKSLVFLYIESFCGLENESFNFELCTRYEIAASGEKWALRRRDDGLDETLWADEAFFGSHISALTLLIGENGSGKTTLLRLLIAWLCELAAGRLPQGKGGALLFRDGEKLCSIAFSNGKRKELEFPEKETTAQFVEEFNEQQAKVFLEEVCLVYYTDTMTDLELSRQSDAPKGFLQDFSLLSRLSTVAGAAARQLGDSRDMRELLGRADFLVQMEHLVDLLIQGKEGASVQQKTDVSDFPIHFIRFEAILTDSTQIAEYDSIRVALEHLNPLKSDCTGKKKEEIIAAVLAFGVIVSFVEEMDSIVSGLFGEAQEKQAFRERIIEALRRTFERGDAASAEALWIGCEDFIYNISSYILLTVKSDGPSASSVGSIEKLTTTYLAVTQAVQPRLKDFIKAFDGWEEEDAGPRRRWSINLHKWISNLESDVQRDVIKSFFSAYLSLSPLMRYCWFDWQYPSSGEINRCNLHTFLTIGKAENERKNVWYFLDEPDNAYHPQWKRKAIQDILYYVNQGPGSAQLWITTHSPIMLSDVPRQAAVFLKRGDPETGQAKKQHWRNREIHQPFAQQIYRLFNDAFFLDKGVSGCFAEEKIRKALEDLIFYDSGNGEAGNEAETQREARRKEARRGAERILSIVDEPLLHGYLRGRLRNSPGGDDA